MKKNKVPTKDSILSATSGGLYFFLKQHPQYWLKHRFGQYVELDSPFHNEKGTLSIYFNDEKGKWFFKDHGGEGYYGDMFSYAAYLHKLNFGKDFRRILQIIEAEMKDYQPPTFNTYRLVDKKIGTYISFFKEDFADDKLSGLFYCTESAKYPSKLVEEFTYLENGNVITKKTSKNEFFVAVEVLAGQFYFILSSSADVFEWGIKPDNLCFGLEQALHNAIFKHPVNRPNVLLCDSILDTLAFSYFGIPAILVDSRAVWNDPYFNLIVRPLFQNIIIAFSSSTPKNLLGEPGLKVFDLVSYIKDSCRDDLRQHIIMDGPGDNILEPIYELYEFIDDDRLVNEIELQDRISIQY